MPRARWESERLSKQVSIRMTEEEYAEIERLAEADERSVTEIARRAFRQGLPAVVDNLRARGIKVEDVSHE